MNQELMTKEMNQLADEMQSMAMATVKPTYALSILANNVHTLAKEVLMPLTGDPIKDIANRKNLNDLSKLIADSLNIKQSIAMDIAEYGIKKMCLMLIANS